MNLEVLYLILPGFVGYHLFVNFRKSHPVHRGNLDFIVSLATFGVVSVVITKKIFGFDESFALDKNPIFLFTSAGIAFLIGILSAFIYTFLVEANKLTDPTDLFTKHCRPLINSPVFVSLKSKKVYVGLLLNFDEYSKNESTGDRSISIFPIKSGTREGEQVKYSTVYDITEISKSVRPILILVRELETIRQFDLDLDKHFQKSAPTTKEKP